MANVSLAPDWGQHFHDDNGNPASGWRVYVFESNTEDYKASYSDPAGTILHTQPIILNARGEYPGQGLYLLDGEAYTLELRTPTGVVKKTVDQVYGSGSGGGGGGSIILPAHTVLGNITAGTTTGYPITIEGDLINADSNDNVPSVGAVLDALDGYLPNSGNNTYTGNLTLDGHIDVDTLSINGTLIDDIYVKKNGHTGRTVIGNIDETDGFVEDIAIEDTLASGSNDTIPTVAAVKTYVDTEITNVENQIAAIGPTDRVSVNGGDTADYLGAKLIAGDGVTITDTGTQLEIAVDIDGNATYVKAFEYYPSIYNDGTYNRIVCDQNVLDPESLYDTTTGTITFTNAMKVFVSAGVSANCGGTNLVAPTQRSRLSIVHTDSSGTLISEETIESFEQLANWSVGNAHEFPIIHTTVLEVSPGDKLFSTWWTFPSAGLTVTPLKGFINVFEITKVDSASSGNVSGNGTENHLARWINATTIADSSILEDANHNIVAGGALNQVATGSFNNLISGSSNSVATNSNQNNIFGYSNIVDGSVNQANIIGQGNRVREDASQTRIIGKSNDTTGPDNTLIGNNNILTGNNGERIVVGNDNNISAPEAMAFGTDNTESDGGGDTHIFGHGNSAINTSSNEIFGSGNILNGTSGVVAVGKNLDVSSTDFNPNGVHVGIGDHGVLHIHGQILGANNEYAAEGKTIGFNTDGEIIITDAPISGKVSADALDTAPDYLDGKLLAGDHVMLAVVDDGGVRKIEITADGSVTRLEDLEDVDVDVITREEGQVIVFNETSQMWENVNSELIYLVDPVLEGQVITYDAVNGWWTNRTPATGAQSQGVYGTLQITDGTGGFESSPFRFQTYVNGSWSSNRLFIETPLADTKTTGISRISYLNASELMIWASGSGSSSIEICTDDTPTRTTYAMFSPTYTLVRQASLTTRITDVNVDDYPSSNIVTSVTTPTYVFTGSTVTSATVTMNTAAEATWGNAEFSFINKSVATLTFGSFTIAPNETCDFIWRSTALGFLLKGRYSNV